MRVARNRATLSGTLSPLGKVCATGGDTRSLKPQERCLCRCGYQWAGYHRSGKPVRASMEQRRAKIETWSAVVGGYWVWLVYCAANICREVEEVVVECLGARRGVHDVHIHSAPRRSSDVPESIRPGWPRYNDPLYPAVLVTCEAARTRMAWACELWPWPLGIDWLWQTECLFRTSSTEAPWKLIAEAMMDGPLDRHPCYIGVVSINGSSTCLGMQARKEDPGNNRRSNIDRTSEGEGWHRGGVGVAMGHMGQAAGGFRGPGVVPCVGTWGGSACARFGFPNRQCAIITIQYCALRVPLSAVPALVASCQPRPTAAAADSAEAGERRRIPVAAAKRRPQMTARRRPTIAGWRRVLVSCRVPRLGTPVHSSSRGRV